MSDVKFVCRRCGHCCNRITIPRDGICIGVCLLPNEEKPFKRFPDAVLPYIALRKPGRRRMQIICHQMVQTPCPLYDAATKTCTGYAERPTACRAYPFSPLYDTNGGYSIETTCAWSKSEIDGIEYGKTPVNIGAEQDAAVLAMSNFFTGLNKRMRRTGYTQLILFDAESHKWIGVGEVP